MANVILSESAVANVRTLDLLDQIVTILGTPKANFLPFFESNDSFVHPYRPYTSRISQHRNNAGADADLHISAHVVKHLPGGLYSYYFAAGSHIYLGDAGQFSFASDEPFSLGCWMQPTNVGPYSLLAKYNAVGTDREWRLAVDASENVFLELYDESEGASEIATGDTVLVNHNWYHVVASYDGDEADPTINIYTNGARDNDGSSVETGAYAGMENGAAQFLMATEGATAAPTNNYSGRLAQPFTTGKALTASEVAEIYRLGRQLIGF